MSLVACILAAACSGDAATAVSGPEEPVETATVSSVEMNPSNVKVAIDESATLSLDVRTADGEPLDREGEWTVRDTGVAVVTGQGSNRRVRGRGEGTTRVIGTVDGVADSASVDVTGGSSGDSGGEGHSAPTDHAAEPVIVEDFSDYGSTDDMLSDPNGLYMESQNEELIELDRTTGVADFGLTQSMRYDFRDVPTVMRRLDMPKVNEVWIEAWVKFSENFRTDWGKDGNPDYKFIFAVTDPSRFNLKTGSFGSQYTVGSPPKEAVARHGSSAEDWDGEWHRYRMHFEHESTDGACDGTVWGWIDDSREFGSRGNVCTDRESGKMWSIKLGANHNQIPEELIQLWWGRIAVWVDDPGW